MPWDSPGMLGIHYPACATKALSGLYPYPGLEKRHSKTGISNPASDNRLAEISGVLTGISIRRFFVPGKLIISGTPAASNQGPVFALS